MSLPYTEETPLIQQADENPPFVGVDGVERLRRVVDRVEDDQVSLVELGCRSYMFGTRVLSQRGFTTPLTEVFSCGFSRPARGQSAATPLLTILMLPASLGIWIGSIWLMLTIVCFDIGATIAKMFTLAFSFFSAAFFWIITGGFVGTVNSWPRFKIFVIFVHNWSWIAMIPFQIPVAASYSFQDDYYSYFVGELSLSMFMLFYWIVLYTSPFIFLMLATTLLRPEIAAAFIALTIETIMNWPSGVVPVGANPTMWGHPSYPHHNNNRASASHHAPAYSAGTPQAPSPSYLEHGHPAQHSSSSSAGPKGGF